MPNRTQSAPGRRTRQRILDVTLALFNERGEPQVSTSLIAAELGISAGNLHYHFRRKDELSAALLERFVGEFDALLPPAGWRAQDVEDAWLLLHLLLETVWRYRFLFRDLSAVMARDRRAAQRLAGVFSRAVEAARAICLGLTEQGTLTATAVEIDALAENVAVVALFWLSFESARHPRQDARSAGMSRGAYQVLMLVAPFLQLESRVHLERLALEYLARH
jgi:AcrR family transcriptional regulator